MKTYLTKQMAMDKYELYPDELTKLLSNGHLKIALLDDEVIILEDDIRSYIAKRDVSMEQFQHLDGQPIMLSDAAKKYNFNTGSLWRWIGQGHIRVLSRDGYRVLLNEADVAFARSLADLKKPRSGQSLFGKK